MRVSRGAFIRVWRTSATLAAVVAATGLLPASASRKAGLLRMQGVDLATKIPSFTLGDVAYPAAKLKRAEAAALGLCVNENKARTHGPSTHGRRCESCYVTHRRTA